MSHPVVSPDSPSLNNFNCQVCQKCCTNRCSKCYQVAYCSKECQVQDWKAHKSDCVPVQVRSCLENNNRHSLFLTKDIPAGEVAWKEKPLVFGCFNTTKYGCFINGSNKTNYCVSCCVEVKPGDRIGCPRCTATICSERCGQSPLHLNNECQVFRNLKLCGVNRYIGGMTPTELTILVRMRNLKTRNPKAWNQLMSLDQNPDKINLIDLSPLHEAWSEDLLMWLRDNTASPLNRKGSVVDGKPSPVMAAWMSIAGTWDLINHGTNDWTLQETEQLLSILEWNGVEDYSQSFVKWLCYYGSSARHSCIPNTVWRVDSKKEIHFRVLVDMKAGDEILITKESYALQEGTPRRQMILGDMYKFTCSCARCTDPSELGTYAAAMKCQRKDCVGYLLPTATTPTGTAHQTQWCKYTWKCTICPTMVDKVPEYGLPMQLQTIVARYNEHPCSQSLISDFLALLKKYEGIRLHPNHYELLTIKELMTEKLSDMVVIALLKKTTTIKSSFHGDADVKYCALLAGKYAQFLLQTGNPAFGPWTHRRGKLLVYLYVARAYIRKFGKPQDLDDLGVTPEAVNTTREQAEKILGFYAVDTFADKNRIAMMEKIHGFTLI